MRVVGLFHATVPVFDLARAERFYRAALGLGRHATPSYFPDQVVFLDLGAAMLHLIRYDGGPPRPAPAVPAAAGDRAAFLAAQAQGHALPTHVALEVDDLAAARARVVAAGGAVVQEIEARPGGLRSLFFLDPDRNWVELVQR